MKYAIYGVNRVAKDFLYIFYDIEIVCFFDEKARNSFCGYPVYSDDKLTELRTSFDKLIICDFDKSSKINAAEKAGYIIEQDYLLEESFFEKLDANKYNSHGRPVLVWGTGRRAQGLYNWDNELSVSAYLDSFQNGGCFNNVKVISPTEISDYKDYYVIVAVAKNDEIVDYLRERDLRYLEDFCTDNDWKNRPSVLLRRTIFDQNQYDLDCRTMLNHLEVGAGGDTACCCTTFIYHSIGNLVRESVDDIWTSAIHRIMCLSNVNHTYSFCKKDMCPFFIDREENAEYDIDEPYENMTEKPSTAVLAYETTCNLKCITCREDYKKVNEEDKQKINVIVNKVKEQLIPGVDFLIAAGDGEVLLCKSYRDIIMSDSVRNIKYLRLLTNGMLFNEKNFMAIRQSTDAKIMMTVSIDAATKETYEMIRCGGDFGVLAKNMEYAAGLREQGELSYLRFNFVVQKMNYQEMPLFVKWGLSLGVDEVFFTKILNWGTYSREEFREISMMEEDEVTPKLELMKILNEPIMNEKIVDLGTIQYGRMEVEDNLKTNYYRWELERKVNGLFDLLVSNS